MKADSRANIWSTVERCNSGSLNSKKSTISASDCTPATWWGGLCRKSPLQSTAKRLLRIPPSSAAAERNFSSYSTIHTKKRNRLTADRSMKLVYCVS